MSIISRSSSRALMQAMWRAFVLSRLMAFFFIFAIAPTLAQSASPPTEKIQALMKLMDDPELRTWVESQSKADGIARLHARPDDVELWDDRARVKIRSATTGLPALPSEYSAAASRVAAEGRAHGMPPAIVTLGLILIAAAAGEWVLRRFALKSRESATLETTITRELVAAAGFGVITLGLFFVADWPPLLRAVLRSWLIAVILFRLVMAIGRILVSANGLSPAIHHRALLFFAVLLAGLATTMLTVPLAIDPNAAQALTFIVSIAILAISMEALWRHAPSRYPVRTRIIQSVVLIALWVLWAIGFHILCWIGLFALFLPGFLTSIEQLGRDFSTARWPGEPHNNVRAVLTIYGLRTVVLAAAVAWLAYVWSSSPLIGVTPGSLGNTIVSGLLKSTVVLLIADFGWRVCKALIDGKLATVSDDAPVAPAEAARRARLRTLLPIFRNALAAVVLLVSSLTVLAELGVEIGPMIAGAGIFGVAIGFGSQTLVKDVISGVFYLMDDAFRIGEYIQSGSYMGTVESFSLRSVRLRHHRGPVFTVPFGDLGAVQNMSRDWVIDKFRLRLTFDADINKVKKLTKAIGAELLVDPDVGALIIDTVKMKGVEQINEYGVELSFAFRATPGNQSMIRRRAYAKLRKAFAENGIEFAQPTVQVGGDDRSDAAAAALTLSEQRKQAEAAEAEASAA